MARKRGAGKMAGAAAKGLMKPLEHVVKEGEELVDVVQTVMKDSKGHVIPPGVKRLPSGRLPGNFEYAGKQFPMDRLPVARDEYGNLYTLSLREKDFGSVWFWDHEEEADEGDPPSEDNIEHRADGWNEFLAGLQHVTI